VAGAESPATAVPAEARPFLVATVVMAAALVVAPHVGIYPVFLMKALCFALFACAFNLLIGFGGLLSFGHAMFLGTAGYVSAHAAKVWGAPPELAILAGTAASALLGVVAGALAIRRQGIYFAMITLALAQMIYFFCLQAPFTHGEDGIQAVPRGKLFGLIDLSNTLVMYYVVLAIFLGAFLLIFRVIHSPFGNVLKAIRENEPRAISLGYDAERYKLLAFVLSATLSGLAGATKAIVFQLASLTDVHWTMSGEVVLMTLLGGMGTIFGPVVGAFTIIGLENYLAGFGQWVTVITGSIFVVCVLAFRRGIVGELGAWWAQRGATPRLERGLSTSFGAGIAGILLGIFSLLYVGLFGGMIGSVAGWLGSLGPYGNSTITNWASVVSILSWLAPLLAIIGGIVTFSNPRAGGIVLAASAFLHWYLLGFGMIGNLFVLPIGAAALLAFFAAPSTSRR